MHDQERRPLIGVGVVVFKEDQVLLIKRGRPPRMGKWSLPGGRQEWGETLFETAKREVLEETGLQIEPVEILTAVDSITRDDGGEIEFHYTLVEVLARWVSGEARAADDAEDARWAGPDALDLLDWEKAREIVRLGRDRFAGADAKTPR